jgi:2-amino-4-hydroxy-6-hydroxymethyldihydropteridine diphosphokinase
VISKTKAAVAIGSNLGDRLAHLRAGVTGLTSLGEVKKISSLYETAPIGGPSQNPYLNAVVTLETDLSAVELLRGLFAIEKRQERIRGEKWGPRTLDLDLIVFGAETLDQPDLVVPHPRASTRRFVLDPLAEVWPDARFGDRTVRELTADVSDQEVVLLARHWFG